MTSSTISDDVPLVRSATTMPPRSSSASDVYGQVLDRRDRSIRGPSPRRPSGPPLYAPQRTESLPVIGGLANGQNDSYHPQTSARVIINVGGTRFETTRGTLAKRPYSYLGKLFGLLPHRRPSDSDSDSDMVSSLSLHDAEHPPNGEHIFIDRNPTYFAPILDLYRTGVLVIPANTPRSVMDRELAFYHIGPISLQPTSNNDTVPTDGGSPITLEFAESWHETNTPNASANSSLPFHHPSSTSLFSLSIPRQSSSAQARTILHRFAPILRRATRARLPTFTVFFSPWCAFSSVPDILLQDSTDRTFWSDLARAIATNPPMVGMAHRDDYTEFRGIAVSHTTSTSGSFNSTIGIPPPEIKTLPQPTPALQMGFFHVLLTEADADPFIKRALAPLRHVASAGMYGWEMTVKPPTSAWL
ncbi:hypothetical protein HDV00_001906 [Rhizophlyctis rosea]|nr:hypothetical protein HDV00_001906 [Rhizophlyctis rosea]